MGALAPSLCQFSASMSSLVESGLPGEERGPSPPLPLANRRSWAVRLRFLLCRPRAAVPGVSSTAQRQCQALGAGTATLVSAWSPAFTSSSPAPGCNCRPPPHQPHPSPGSGTRLENMQWARCPFTQLLLGALGMCILVQSSMLIQSAVQIMQL